MKNLIPLMRREWLQHRFAWSMLMLIPLALAVLLLGVGQVEFDGAMARHSGAELAVMLGSVCIVATAGVIFLLVWTTSMFIASSLPRRDHADRSVEFWLSLPTGHAESLAAPLIVHLLLVPAAALVVGLLGGYALSLVLVTRFVGFGEWLALPWSSVLAGTLSVVARVIVGLPMATLWLGPLILLSMLANAMFRRWGLPVLVAGLGLGAVLLKAVFGQPLLSEVLAGLSSHAATSLMGASGEGLAINDQMPPLQALAGMTSWAAHDLLMAVRDLASPLFLGAMLVSAALFMALVVWRQRGAGVASS